MPRSGFVRFAGLAGIVGGIAYILTLLFIIAYNASGLQLSYPTPVTWVLLPSLWLFFLVALLGFYSYLAKRAGWVSWLLAVVACAGALMIFIGGVGINYVWYTNSLTLEHVLTNDPVGEALRYNLYAANFLGYPILGLGLLGGGWLAARTRALGRLSALPLILGALSIAVYFFMDMGAPSLLRNTGTPGLLVMAGGQLLFALVWACSWIAIGRRLRAQQGEGAVSSGAVA
jgi:hypothetical protein